MVPRPPGTPPGPLRFPPKVFMPLLWLFLLLSMTLLTGCHDAPVPDAGCMACHRGLEPASASHTGCVSCHGGDGAAAEKTAAHASMLGPRNPADPAHWEKSCGACHPHQLDRVRGSLMYTNTGMIRNIQQSWEGEDGRLYASGEDDRLYDARGEPLSLQGVAELDNLAGELYRKFCSLCHVRIESTGAWTASHASGCAACHFPYNDNGTYQGNDPTMQGKWPHSASHQMASLPGNDVCFRCHNRSGRIALSYQGLYDGNNALVPTRDGIPGPELISGARSVVSIPPDIHHEKGMDCIDCHTSRDVMGDGYAYRNLYEQVEITCEDCHGSPTERPRARAVLRENEAPLLESRSYPQPVRSGMSMVLTAKERPYSNVYLEGEKVLLQGKRSGKLHESKVVTGTPEHTVAGHERLECHSCHSRTVVQCYGCHTRYDRSQQGMDYIKGRPTPGLFSEAEDYRTLYPFPLALDQQGRIAPVTPGCQTFVTVIGPEGEPEKSGYVARYKGKNQLRFAPIYSHNTGSRAVGCTECHGDPAFLGFGQHVVTGADIEATLLCERSDDKPLDGFLVLTEGKVRAFSVITREHSRALNASEVKRVWKVNLCLACHRDPKDPIYQKKLDYAKLEECLRRPGVPARPSAGPGGR